MSFILFWILPLVGIALLIFSFFRKDVDKSKKFTITLGKASFKVPFALVVFSSILVGIVIMTGVKALIFNLGELINPEYKLEESKVIAACDDGSKIYSAAYWSIFWESKNYFIYYQRDGKIVDLSGSLDENLIEKNSKRNLEKYKDNSFSESFPALDFMQKQLKYEVVNLEDFVKQTKTAKEKMPELQSPNMQYNKEKYGLDSFYTYQNFPTLYAIYINPQKVSQDEFKSIFYCFKDIETSPKIAISPVIIYGLPQRKSFYKNEPNPTAIFDQMLCQQSKIIIENSGIVRFGLNREISHIGYFDSNGNFVREEKVDKEFSYPKAEDNKYTSELEEVGFEKAYQESQTLKLLFNDKQQPIDEYLKTCKNENGKTLFDLFKEP